jgi:hypothetical protein
MSEEEIRNRTGQVVKEILAEDSRKVSRVYGKDGTVITTSQQWLVEPGHIMRVDHFDLDGKAPVFTHIRFGSQGTFYDLFSELYDSYEGDIRLNNEYINGVELPEGFRTASSGLILPVSAFPDLLTGSVSPDESTKLLRDWQKLGRFVAAKLIIGLGYGSVLFMSFAPIFFLIVWQDEVFKPIFAYLFRPSDTPLTHGDLIILVISSTVVFVLIWAFRLWWLMILIWMRETHLLSWRVKEPLRFTPEVISQVRASWKKTDQ